MNITRWATKYTKNKNTALCFLWFDTLKHNTYYTELYLQKGIRICQLVMALPTIKRACHLPTAEVAIVCNDPTRRPSHHCLQGKGRLPGHSLH